MKRFLTAFLALLLLAGTSPSQTDATLRFCLHSEPKTLNPLLVSDEASEMIRYLTGGVLIRVNRRTQELEPELAVSWVVSSDGKRVDFELRPGVKFSNGAPFSSADVAHTFRLLMDPDVPSATGDSFRSGSGAVETCVTGELQVSVVFPAAVAGVERLFDQVAIVSAGADDPTTTVLGPYRIRERHLGRQILLERNPNYWKRDARGRRLPRIGSIQLDIQQNRQLELLRFERGEIHLINKLDPETFERLRARSPAAAVDSGPGFEPEQMWFNQTPAAPMPEYKKQWFRSAAFRRAISAAINREDLCRIVYLGLATPAAGPVSPANLFWFNRSLAPQPYEPERALRILEVEGFRLNNGVLEDAAGHPVEFSLITNSGNQAREQMATMIQYDLSRIGVKVNIVPLDFRSLIERITRTFDYEACLLGLVNVDLDPNGQMNVWLSSGSNHQWNPGQESAATEWEAEIDQLMREQASTMDRNERKAAFDRVQRIAWEQVPFIYLVYKNALSAVSPSVRNADVAVNHPEVIWNVEHLELAAGSAGRR